MSTATMVVRNGFSKRFGRAFAWLGIPVLILVALPIAAILAQEVWSAGPFQSEPPLDLISMGLLGLAGVEVVGVYAWHIPHYGFSFDRLIRRDKVRLNWLLSICSGLIIGVALLGGDPILKVVVSAFLFLSASLFSGIYIRSSRLVPAG